MQITIELPEDIAVGLQSKWKDLPRAALESLAVPIGNPIGGRSWSANSGCSSHASSGATEKREKSTLLSANKTGPVLSALRIGTPVRGWNCGEFRLRVARSGGEVRQLVVWQLRRRVLAGARVADPAGPWPVRGASWIRDNTPKMISRAGTVKPRSERSRGRGTRGESCR